MTPPCSLLVAHFRVDELVAGGNHTSQEQSSLAVEFTCFRYWDTLFNEKKCNGHLILGQSADAPDYDKTNVIMACQRSAAEKNCGMGGVCD